MHHKQSSFTLIEVLLALFITAILITILSIIFNTGLRAYRQGKDLLEITRKAQFILGQMTKEISGAMVQANFIYFEINNNGNNDSIYFMSPIENASVLDLCEIGYSLNDTNVDGVLDLRRHFITYGPTDFQYPVSKTDYTKWPQAAINVFCTNVTQLNFRYRLVNGSWPPDDKWTKWTSNTQIPEMIEIQVRIQGQYGNPPQFKDFTTWVYIPNSTVNP